VIESLPGLCILPDTIFRNNPGVKVYLEKKVFLPDKTFALLCGFDLQKYTIFPLSVFDPSLFRTTNA
jgi:hypothetical protein